MKKKKIPYTYFNIKPVKHGIYQLDQGQQRFIKYSTHRAGNNIPSRIIFILPR